MVLKDFKAWAEPSLRLPWGDRIYEVHPPSVGDAKKVLAAAVRAEIELGLVDSKDVPDGALEVLNDIEPGDAFSLGAAYDEMAADGVPQRTIDRMAYYAVFYWARSEAYADWVATIMFAPREVADVNPKARSSSQPKTGRRGASASRTQTAGSPTTGRSRRS